MVKIAGYIYGFNKKKDASYDLESLTNYLLSKAAEKNATIDEIYADGYVEMPQGLDELLDDLNQYDAVVLYSLEGISEENMMKLSTKQLFCVTAPWVDDAKLAGKKFLQIIQSRPYFDTMRRLNIRMGIGKSDKNSGAAPFGYDYGEDGKLKENHDEMLTIRQMIQWRNNNMSVMEIAERTGLVETRVYRILNNWKKGNE